MTGKLQHLLRNRVPQNTLASLPIPVPADGTNNKRYSRLSTPSSYSAPAIWSLARNIVCVFDPLTIRALHIHALLLQPTFGLLLCDYAKHFFGSKPLKLFQTTQHPKKVRRRGVWRYSTPVDTCSREHSDTGPVGLPFSSLCSPPGETPH